MQRKMLNSLEIYIQIFDKNQDGTYGQERQDIWGPLGSFDLVDRRPKELHDLPTSVTLVDLDVRNDGEGCDQGSTSDFIGRQIE